MAKKIIIRTLVSLFWLFVWIAGVQAQETSLVYKVIASSNSNIAIRNKYVQPNCSFNDTTEIQWAKDEMIQILVVSNTKKAECEIIEYNEGKVEIKPEKEYVSEHGTSGLGLIQDKRTFVKGYMDYDNTALHDTHCWLKDTLLIPAPWNFSKSVKAYSIVYLKNDSITNSISRSMDMYIIPRKVVGTYNKPFYLDIIEKDGEWEYVVWRKLYVIPLPLKID